MTQLDEVPGAGERPSGSLIAIRQMANGNTTVTIPPRQVPPIIGATIGLLVLQILLTLYMGMMLFLFHRSVLVMTQIAPHDIPRTLQHYRVWLMLGWVLAEGIGFLLLTTALRPMLTTETLTIGPAGIEFERKVGRRHEHLRFARTEVQGFHLKRDPEGLNVSALLLQSRGERLSFAEACSESEREWLASVGNALLRQM